jgi:hypothetical protein
MKDGSDRDLSTDTLTEGQWYHVVYQRDSGTVQGFLDGVSLGTITVTNDFTNTTIEVGVNRGGTAYYSGNLRDVRIIKGTALYSSSGFTPPTEPLEAVSGTGYSTTLLTCHLPYIADGGANSLTPTVNGDTKVEALTPFDSSRYTPSIHGGSMYFNGSGDYLQVPQAAAARGTGDYTIECWVYSKTFANEKFIFDARSAASAIDDFMTINSSGYLFFRSNGTTTTTTQQMSLNTWHHFAQVRNGSTLKVYVDGVEVASKTQSGNLSIASAFDIGGSSNDGASATIDGYISDFRIVLGTAVYTSAFTPPTAPLTAITNTSLLLSGTNAGIIDKSQSVKELTLNGDVKSSTTQTKYLTSSMYFDGTGDYLELSRGQDLDIFNLGTSDFTVEMWLFPTDLSNSGTIISFIRANNTSDDNHPHIYRAASELRFYTDGTDKISGGTLSLSTWHHVAISRSGNDHKMFLDGSQVGSTYTASNTYTQGRPVVASYNDTLTTVGSANLFTGYISDVRITSGLARYTSNFTPPTAALGG